MLIADNIVVGVKTGPRKQGSQRSTRQGSGASAPEWKSEECPLVATVSSAAKVQIGLEGIRKLAQHVTLLVQGNLQPRLRSRHPWQMAGVRIKNDNVVAAGK